MKWSDNELKYLEKNRKGFENYNEYVDTRLILGSPSVRLILLIHYLKYGANSIILSRDDNSPNTGSQWYVKVWGEFSPDGVRIPIDTFTIQSAKIELFELKKRYSQILGYGDLPHEIIKDIVNNCKIDYGFKGRLVQNGKRINF